MAFQILEDIKPLREIEAMPYDRARNYFIDARAKYTTAQLIAHWKMTSTQENIYGSKVYKTFEKYDVPVHTERTRKAHETRSAKSAQTQNETIRIFDERPTEKPVEVPFSYYKAVEVTSKKKTDKAAFTISLEGEWNGKQIAERIRSIANLLKNDTQYNIKIELQETGE